MTRASVFGAAVAALALAVPAAAGAGGGVAAPARPPGPLVVALGLQSPVLQAGVVRGRDVILARGFEVELVRTLARRLGTRVGRFVYVRSPSRLLASSDGGWQVGVAGIEPDDAVRGGTDLSIPYLTTDVVVVARRGLSRPRRLADLGAATLCAVRGSVAAKTTWRLHPDRTPLLVAGVERLRSLLRAGSCDAALVPAAEAGRLVAEQHGELGRAVGRIPHGDGLVVAVPRAGGVDVAAVDRELRRLRRDGTLGRLSRQWLGLDPAVVPVLR